MTKYAILNGNGMVERIKEVSDNTVTTMSLGERGVRILMR